MIRIENITMRYPLRRRYRDYLLHPFAKRKYFLALKNINLEIAEGDCVAFLGVNGAGKTTLLKLIGGLLYPHKGRIFINGYDSRKQNNLARKSVGFVLSEERSFYWRLTGLQNLEFFGALDNLFGPELQTNIHHLIEMVGLSMAADTPVANYSSGMKQRLAIARGLLSDPTILILDEPTKALDPKAKEQIKEIILRKIQSNRKRTILIATHRFEEAESLCNKVCFMGKGRLLGYKSLEEIADQYNSLADSYNKILNEENS